MFRIAGQIIQNDLRLKEYELKFSVGTTTATEWAEAEFILLILLENSFEFMRTKNAIHVRVCVTHKNQVASWKKSSQNILIDLTDFNQPVFLCL